MTPALPLPSQHWHTAQRELMCHVGKSMFDRGYVHATAGNMSVRVPREHGGGLLITPTDACLGWMEAGDIVWLDAQLQALTPGRASKSVHLHQQIYGADPDAHCIIHTHSTHLVAMSLRSPGVTGDDLLPPITPYFVMKVGHVPRIAYRRPGDPAVGALAAQVIQAARTKGRQLHALMLDRLGPNVWHRDLRSALATLEELEETARLCMLAGALPAPLDEDQLDELRRYFGASW